MDQEEKDIKNKKDEDDHKDDGKDEESKPKEQAQQV